MEIRAELRSSDEKPSLEGDNKVAGYAAVFNSRSQDLGGFVEVLEPGAFDKCLSEAQDVRCLFNHDSNCVIGRTRAGTCQISSDEHGLKYSADLADRTLDRDLRISMKRGDITGSSFAFAVAPDGDRWDRDASGLIVRTIKRGGIQFLYDVSPVTYPAYLAADSCIRSYRGVIEAGEAHSAELKIKAESVRRAEVVKRQRWLRQIEAVAKF